MNHDETTDHTTSGVGVMSAAEWLDGVRADLRRATPGPWRWRNTEEPLLVGARSRIVMAFSRMGTQRAQPEFRDMDGLLEKAGKANLNSYPDARLIASAPDRLDRMERALRAVLDLAVAVNAAAIIPTSEPIMNAGYRIALGDIVTAIKEALGDE